MNKLDIKDNFLPESLLDTLVSKVLSPSFKWSYSTVVDGIDVENDMYNFQFVHTLYYQNKPTSDFFEDFSFAFNCLRPNSLVKCKINFNPCYKEVIQHKLHTDVPFECKTSILYLNTNDGYTLFEDGSKVESVSNRLVTFNSQLKHTGTTCTNSRGRIVLNVNYF
jgi:hypothetical protein